MMRWIRRVAVILVVALLVLVGCVVAGLGALRLAAHFRETELASAAAPADGKFIESGHGRMFVMDPGPVDGIPRSSWQPSYQRVHTNRVFAPVIVGLGYTY